MSSISKILPAPPDNFSTTLSSNITSADTTISVNSVSGLNTEGIGVIYQKDNDGNPVAATIEFIHWTGISGSDLTLSDTGDRGLTGSASGAQAHTSGDTFEVWVHSKYYPTEGILVEHNDDGTHDNTIVGLLGGTQTFTGNKTFSGTLTATGAAEFDSTAQFDGVNTFNGDAVFTKRRETFYDNGNSGTAATINWNNGATQKITLTGNCTFTFSNAEAGDYLTLRVAQDGTGSRTITFPATTRAPGGAAELSTGANDIDYIGIRCYATNEFEIVAIVNDMTSL